MTITKLDAAERQIVAAVRLLFDGGDPVPIYALAAAAREITTALCEHRGIRSMIDKMEDIFSEKTRKQIFVWVHRHAAFFKHARTDPDGLLEDFEADEAEAVLYLACSDFSWLCEGPRIAEILVFEEWYLAKQDASRQNKMFHDLGRKSRAEQIELGRQSLHIMRIVESERNLAPD